MAVLYKNDEDGVGTWLDQVDRYNRNNMEPPLLTYPQRMEISVSVQSTAETVQVTALFCKPWVTVVVEL